MQKPKALRPAQVAARRVVEARESRGWSQAELARRLEEIGYPKSASTLSKLESGSYRNVSLDDAFALAAALGLSPVHLLTPLDDQEPVAVTPRLTLDAWLVRAWVRGDAAIPPWLPALVDARPDLSQIPDTDLVRLVEHYLERDLNRSGSVLGVLARETARVNVRPQALKIVKQIREAERKETSDAN